MSFTLFVILLVIGFMMLQSPAGGTKLLGVLLLVVALNPLCISLTGKSIPDTAKAMWQTGERAYNKTNSTLKDINDTLTDKKEK